MMAFVLPLPPPTQLLLLLFEALFSFRIWSNQKNTLKSTVIKTTFKILLSYLQGRFMGNSTLNEVSEILLLISNEKKFTISLEKLSNRVTTLTPL